ncbi:MAG: hypothetical protein HY092_02485 [Candidatus Kerfeldbacteria bacterium]|nr:hypothetical protein [Candidatus Kerfeldbacteria bacterium]
MKNASWLSFFLVVVTVSAAHAVPISGDSATVEHLLAQAPDPCFGDAWDRWLASLGEASANYLLEKPAYTFRDFGSSYALAINVLATVKHVSPTAIDNLKHVMSTSAWYDQGMSAAEQLTRVRWTPASKQERIVYFLAMKRNREAMREAATAGDILIWLYRDSTYTAIRGQLLTAMRGCRDVRLVDCYLDALVADQKSESDATGLRCPDMNNSILTMEANQGLIATWPLGRRGLPVMLNQIKLGNATPIWLLLRDPEDASEAMQACLAAVHEYGSESARAFRVAFDEYARNTPLAPRNASVGRIPDRATRAMVQVLLESRQPPFTESDEGITDSRLHMAVRRGSLYPQVLRALKPVQAAHLAGLAGLDDERLGSYLQVLTATQEEITGAAGQLHNLTETMRLIVLANRSETIRDYVKKNPDLAPTSIEVTFPWDAEHYPKEDTRPITVRLPRVR